MATRDDAKKVADAKACELLLADHTLTVAEDKDHWVFTYSPKGRVRGGGFRITVSRSTLQVTEVVRYQ